MQRTRYEISNMKTFIYIHLKSSYPVLFPELLLTQIIPPPKKTNPTYKTIAHAGSEGRGAEEIYHTSGPPCFIM